MWLLHEVPGKTLWSGNRQAYIDCIEKRLADDQKLLPEERSTLRAASNLMRMYLDKHIEEK